MDIIAFPLSVLINACFDSGVFPEEFKVTKVIPLFKKGDENIPDNYRPISIIPIFAKIFEKLLKAKLVQYFEDNSLFNPCQFGFRRNQSTTQAAQKAVSYIVEGLEQGKRTALTLCDLSKAFVYNA